RHVTIPYRDGLAARVPPIAVRLRRDFGAVLNLIRAHALLHQASRERDGDGQIIATLDDYAAVRDLVHDLIAAGVDATVSQVLRETVEAVERLVQAGASEIAITEVGRELRLDKSAAWRRVHAAVAKGYLRNLEERKGRAARIVLGDPL